ncbi:protein NO VEIN domain-containing protein [Cupriavidus oxalaticus]|uniref:protein NO VEIN domain-containing protein n=1 Tax=Cupriavidus oxalaticus TaxID=96344 RepID=UPI003D1655E8
MTHYKGKGFDCERVTHLPCGYDFIFSKGRTTLHVEVKGTSGDVPQFFLTRNEYGKGMRSNSRWRLAMVTSALSEPNVVIYDAVKLQKTFDLDPYVYVGKFVPAVI